MKPENQECCPKFNIGKWNKKTFSWHHKPFITASVPTFFHIPYPPMIAKQITRLMKMATDSQKLPKNKEDVLVLFADPHPFKTEILLSVTDKVPGAKNTTLSGTFMSEVFDGKFKMLPKFIKQMTVNLESLNKEAKTFYVHYAYCPGCAVKFGHNYMVLFAQVETNLSNES